MINLEEQIKEAMKARNTVKLAVLRAIKAEKLNYLTAKNAKEYTDESEIGIIKKLLKQNSEEIENAKIASREDLISDLNKTKEELEKFLPAVPSLSELRDTLEFCLSENTGKLEINKKEMGNYIKFLKSKFPSVDGKEISNLVKEYVV